MLLWSVSAARHEEYLDAVADSTSTCLSSSSSVCSSSSSSSNHISTSIALKVSSGVGSKSSSSNHISTSNSPQPTRHLQMNEITWSGTLRCRRHYIFVSHIDILDYIRGYHHVNPYVPQPRSSIPSNCHPNHLSPPEKPAQWPCNPLIHLQAHPSIAPPPAARSLSSRS